MVTVILGVFKVVLISYLLVTYLATYSVTYIPENQTPIDLPIFPFSLIVSRRPPHDHPLAPCPP